MEPSLHSFYCPEVLGQFDEEEDDFFRTALRALTRSTDVISDTMSTVTALFSLLVAVEQAEPASAFTEDYCAQIRKILHIHRARDFGCAAQLLLEANFPGWLRSPATDCELALQKALLLVISGKVREHLVFERRTRVAESPRHLMNHTNK